MGRIRVSVRIPATPAAVWDVVRDLQSHVEWMAEAESLTFTSSAVDGVGATFVCRTRVGPFTLTDEMEVIEWRPQRAIGIRHVGAVSGVGRFTMRRSLLGGTRFVWREELRYPRWMGGAVGGAVIDEVLRWIWWGNLRRLRARVAAATDLG